MRQSMYNVARAEVTLKIATRTDATATGTTVDLHENLDASESALVLIHSRGFVRRPPISRS